ncbi:hypothetical protein GCM10009804_41220 [Kribbella hippodromi]|uniref:SMI1/KNR4 family protein n=1 Tax=Kribbella hippodromi TaxID=434347 RepID=A0ABN2DM69_9ACTN
MKFKDRPLDLDAAAMADLAEIADWTKVAGPDAPGTGYEAVKALVTRVSAGTGWEPWPANDSSIDWDKLESWGFETDRGTTMIVFNGLVLADVRDSGWSAYDLAADDIEAAAAGLDEHWPAAFELAVRTWGPPVYASDYRNPAFLDEFRPGAGFDRRHLAVWPRVGAQFFLYSDMPTVDPLSPSVGINYTVYLD